MSAATSKVRKPRIKYPADAIRTREQILAKLPENAILHRGIVWVTCHNCGGRGTYPSQMIPPGLCRLYCWAKRHTDAIAQAMGAAPPSKSADDPTYGRLPVSIDNYVKRCQAADRADYRAELARPAREAAQRQWQLEQDERDRAEREAFQREQEDIAARKAVSDYVGTPSAKLTCQVTLVDSFSIEGQYGWRTQFRFRDDAGNVLVWWTGAGISWAKGDRGTITGTVKSHTEYDGERQTTLLRVKVAKAGDLTAPVK